jgi:hypothetical protein
MVDQLGWVADSNTDKKSAIKALFIRDKAQ